MEGRGRKRRGRKEGRQSQCVILIDSIKPSLWQTFLQCPLNLLKTGNPKQFHLPAYTSIFVLRVFHIKIHRLVDLTRNFSTEQLLQLKGQDEGVARFDFSRGCLAWLSTWLPSKCNCSWSWACVWLRGLLCDCVHVCLCLFVCVCLYCVICVPLCLCLPMCLSVCLCVSVCVFVHVSKSVSLCVH